MLCDLHRLYTECGYPQVLAQSTMRPKGSLEPAPSSLRRCQPGLRPAAPLVRDLDHPRADQVQRVIRIAIAAWRVSPRPQRLVMRRPTAATSSSGSPTGQTADAPARSGESPATSEDASPSRAYRRI